MLAENDVLTDRANQLDTFDDPSTPSGRKHSQLQQQLETLQEENFRFVCRCLNVLSQPHRGATMLTADGMSYRKLDVLFLADNSLFNQRKIKDRMTVYFYLLGWKLRRMTTASTVKSWRSS